MIDRVPFLPPLPRSLILPVNFALMFWQASMWMSGNVIEAMQMYHDLCSEVLDLVRP